MRDRSTPRSPLSGRFSPLRYPGGKGKLARFVAEIVRQNRLYDGFYVEPYAGGGAVAWELLITGMVRRVHVNDLSRPIYAFWRSVLDHTDELARLINDTALDIDTWKKMKRTFSTPDEHDDLSLGFATFYLNRTNRSGILNGGPIGGHLQEGAWGIDARYNRAELIVRVERIAKLRKRITLTNIDAVTLLNERRRWPKRTLIYLDPPYFTKGRDLYYDYYDQASHAKVAEAVRRMEGAQWIVSYDDVGPIHALYDQETWLQYRIGYSARNRLQGREAMFFSSGLQVPATQGSMIEIDRCCLRVEPTYHAPRLVQVETDPTRACAGV
ncbi:DNA adenine methylase [uncultured Enterovirga sp.]|uniref:DNA adenine methylase n=1 Tax=uncultured Enterovirga sp. TaxID=2026352 RepID=UPI0035C9FC2A